MAGELHSLGLSPSFMSTEMKIPTKLPTRVIYFIVFSSGLLSLFALSFFILVLLTAFSAFAWSLMPLNYHILFFYHHGLVISLVVQIIGASYFIIPIIKSLNRSELIVVFLSLFAIIVANLLIGLLAFNLARKEDRYQKYDWHRPFFASL